MVFSDSNEMKFESEAKDSKSITSAKIFSCNGTRNKIKLTRREMEVLEMIKQGFTTRQTATQLYVSENTVETHRKNIIQKSQARNIVHAVVKAMRLGIIQ